MEFNSVEDILDFAVKNEEEAEAFYRELSEKVDSRNLKDTLLQYAEEEKKHKQKLLAVKRGERDFIPGEKIVDMKISDYMVDVTHRDGLSYQDVLVLAMKAEKAAYRLYMDLAAKTTDSSMKELFLALAAEEAKHKLRFEIEYDEGIMTDN